MAPYLDPRFWPCPSFDKAASSLLISWSVRMADVESLLVVRVGGASSSMVVMGGMGAGFLGCSVGTCFQKDICR
jgi:hypothetical protein